MRRVTGKKEMYTGKGDGGRTSLLGKQKVSKGSHRIDLLGELDEFSSALGLARAHSELEASRSILLAVQRDVYILMAELATTGKAEGSGAGPGCRAREMARVADHPHDSHGQDPRWFHRPRGYARRRGHGSGAHGGPACRAACRPPGGPRSQGQSR